MADERVTLHLKVDRAVRDQLLGRLRGQGITMQHFFETFMHVLLIDEQTMAYTQAICREYAPTLVGTGTR
jgi:hypothetical protein